MSDTNNIDESEDEKSRSRYAIIIIGVILLLFAIGWKYIESQGLLDLDALASALKNNYSNLEKGMIIIGLFVIGGLVVIPLNVMIVFTSMIFAPWVSMLYCFIGTNISSSLCYWLGRLVGLKKMKSLVGEKAYNVAKKIADKGFVPVLIFRVLPLAPFTFTCALGGAIDIKFSHYFWATLLGTLPGILAFTIMGKQTKELIQQPTWENALYFIGAVAIVVLLTWFNKNKFKNWLDKKA